LMLPCMEKTPWNTHSTSLYEAWRLEWFVSSDCKAYPLERFRVRKAAIGDTFACGFVGLCVFFLLLFDHCHYQGSAEMSGGLQGIGTPIPTTFLGTVSRVYIHTAFTCFHHPCNMLPIIFEMHTIIAVQMTATSTL
jgi:hypothetical protein